MPDVLILDELKSLILRKNAITVISPSDCRSISISIQRELNKNISETTLKRFFGFAAIQHPFSKFTINTLKEYANFQQLAPIEHQTIQTIINEDLSYIKQIVTNLTQFTLRNIRNRCSVPFEMTIGRKFAKYDFEFFYDSPHSFTSFIAQPGYGKSILMYHLVQEMFLQPDSKYKNDIVLFINADFIFNVYQNDLDFEEILKAKMGFAPTTNLITYFKEQYEKTGTKLIIFLDGFSELVLNKNFKPKIFDCITAFISAIEDDAHIKIVLSMRSTTWSRFYERMRHAYFLKKKWFAGSYYHTNYNANVPPLNENELEAILQKMGPLDYVKMSTQLKSELKFPFHIQWYYKLREEYPAFNSYTNVVFFEIINKFIQEKIYKSTYATEKIIFCKKIVQLTSHGRLGQSILKTNLITAIGTFTNAYMQLLADGILMEEKQYVNGYPVEFVRFIQPHVFEYFLFIETFDIYNQQLEAPFFNFIQTEYFGNQSRFQLLQWAVRILVEQKKLANISALLALNLSNYEKNYLIYFIAENLNYRIIHDPLLKEIIKEQQLHQLLIQEFVHFDFIDSCYKEAILSLLSIVDTNENALLYNAILAIFDCLSLDRQAMLNRLESLKNLSEEAKNWEIDPYEALKLVYLKTHGETVLVSETLDRIEKFKTIEKFLSIKNGTLPNTKQLIGYILMLVVNLFYGSPTESIKIIGSIFKRYPKLVKTRNSFSIYLFTLLAQACGRINEKEKTDQMERILIALSNGYLKNNFTLYTKTILLSFKAEQSRKRKEYDQAIQYAKDCISIYKRNNLAINKIFMYNLLIDVYTKIGQIDKADAYVYRKLNLLDKKKVNAIPFHNHGYT